MGSITLVVEEQCEFEQDEREFEPGYHQRTRDYLLARRSEMNLLHQSYCWNCGKTKAAKIHKGPITREVEVPDNVEEMYENAKKADSRDFDYAAETEQRGWEALAVLGHVANHDAQGWACVSDELLHKTNWRMATEMFDKVENGKWAEYSTPNTFFGSSTIIIFDPTHAPTAEVASGIDDALFDYPILDEMAYSQAQHDELAEALTGWLGRGSMPNGIDIDEVIRQLHQHEKYDDDSSITQKMVEEVVKVVAHAYDEGFDQEDPEDDDSPYLCVCGLKETAEIHREEIPGQQRIEFKES